MRLVRAVVAVTRAWLDVRFLRWADTKRRPLHLHHGDKPRLPGYRRK